MEIKRDQYVRTTATRMAEGILASYRNQEPGRVAAEAVAECAFDLAETMADEAEKRGLAQWDTQPGQFG